MKIMEISKLQKDIAEWSEKAFGDGVPGRRTWRFPGMFAHLKREIDELDAIIFETKLNGPTQSIIEEIADCAMLLMDMADQLDADLLTEMAKKLEVNKKRKWGKPNADGSVEHIKDETSMKE